jgi:hypothetical protein
MNEWACVTFDEFMEHNEELQNGALALAAHEPSPPIRLFPDEPFEKIVARTNCTLRIQKYVLEHREALWGAGLLQDRDHIVRVQNKVFRALHAYFTDPSRVTDAPDPPAADIIRAALADARPSQEI